MIYILVILTAACGILVAYIIYNNGRTLKISPNNYINPNDTMGVDYDIFGSPGYDTYVSRIEVLVKKRTKYPITVNLEQNAEGVLIVEVLDTFSEN